MKKNKAIKESKAVKKNKAVKVNKAENKNKAKLSLFGILIILSLLPLVLSIGLISVISLNITTGNMESSVKDELYIVATNLASFCEERKITAVSAEQYMSYLDSLKDKNIEMAIMLEGVPSATSIRNKNNYRIREIEFKKDIVADRAEIENGYFDEYVLIDEQEYFAYYMPIWRDGDIIGMAFAGQLHDHVNSTTQSIVITYASIAVFLIAVFAVIVFVFSRGLIKSFNVIGKNVDALSQGNLTKQKQEKSAVKEMNALLLATSSMQGNLSETIGKVKDISQKLAHNVSDAAKLSQSSAERAKQITSVVEAQVASVEGMSEDVQDISTRMMEIGDCVNGISENVEDLTENSENMQATNNEARMNMNVILENSRKSVEAVNDISVQISQTNDVIQQIHTAVELILEMSEQTNLLSLNASIEAARAGESGRGFAVVAEEIRRLSEQSADGAEMIRNLAGEITEKSQQSVKLADNVSSLIRMEQENVVKTQQKYEELSKVIDGSTADIKAIAERTEHLTKYKERVIEKIQALSAVSVENAEGSRDVDTNVREIIAEVGEVSVNCERLNDMAGILKESVSFFND